MKLYHTLAGIIIEKQQELRVLRDVLWDELIDNDALYQRLQELWPALEKVSAADALLVGSLLPPMQSQELWAAGVTYLRSKVERQEESKAGGGADFYQRVYEAERPELFFKSNRHRVVGHGEHVRIRRDSTWNVPEPELTLVVTSNGRIVGYTIGNDMSSRSIEGENPLYLPQAKIWDGCAAVGPCVLVSEGDFPRDARIHLAILREGVPVYEGSVEVDRIQRRFEDLVSYLFRECSFPAGVLLMTGTGIVPDAPFTLEQGDLIRISIDHIGTLENSVA